MRIIGGTLKKKNLCSLQGLRIRPTTDFLRESIFNILTGRVEDTLVLDLFAGTGSLGIEALSRGAASAVFVDHHTQAMKILARNIAACCLEQKSVLFKRDILRGLGFLKKTDRVFDLVFMDPPYGRGFAEQTLHLLDRCECTAPEACLVIEHSLLETLPERVEHFERTSKRQHGKSLVSFYESVL